MAISHGDNLTGTHARCAALDYAPALHIAQERHWETRGRLLRKKHTEVLIPAGMQIWVRSFEKRELRSCRKPRVQRFYAKPAFLQRTILVLKEISFSRLFDTERTHRNAL